jgi:hypothetical protein
MVRLLVAERDCERQRAEDQQRRAEENQRQAEELRVEMLRLQLELERYKKWYYGPRADRLQSSGDVAQMLLSFAEELDHKPIHPDDVPPAAPRNCGACGGRRAGAISRISRISPSPRTFTN